MDLQIVAHRGAPDPAPENTIPSFERAIDLGADAVELDVRLTADRVPVVHHYLYLDQATDASGPIFERTFVFRHLWESIEVTSYEPVLLLALSARCPGIPVDLLFPRSEAWMRLDVIAYLAGHRARLARARAVHLHPSQLAPGVVSAVRRHGIEVHAWDVNDEQALRTAVELKAPRVCTDRLERALQFRQGLPS